MMSEVWVRRCVWGLVVLGFAIRLGLGVARGLDAPPAPGSDAEEYDTYAWNMAQGRGYRGMSPDVADQDHLTAYRPPGTSVAWAGVYAVTGHRYAAIRLLNCVLGAATIAAVFAIGRRCFSPGIGLLASAGYAVYPHAIFYSSELLSETQGTLLFVLYLLACLRFADGPSWGRAAWAGVLLGLTMLTRPAALFLIPFTAVWAFWTFRRSWDLLRFAALPVTTGACLVPWIVRNYLVFHAFIPFSTMGGSVLLQGNNRLVCEDPSLRGYSVWDTKIPEYAAALKAPNDELVRDQVAGRLAKEWIRAHPDRWAFLAVAKLERAFTPFLQDRSPRLYRLGMLWSWGPVLLLSLAAFLPTLIAMFRSGNPGWLLHAGIAHYAVVSLVFFGYSRYRHPIEPLCLVLSAAAVAFAWERLGGTLRGFLVVSRLAIPARGYPTPP